MTRPLSDPDPDPPTQWDEAIARNTALFREADLLDEIAYKLIQTGDENADVWLRFTEAKALADARRRAAYEDWMNIKRMMGRR